VDVEGGATVATITVPVLEEDPFAQKGAPAPAPPPAPNATRTPEEPPPPVTSDSSAGDTQRWIGLAVGGAGVVGVALGTVFGLDAKSKLDDSGAHCGAGNVCDAAGVELRDDAIGAGTRSTIAFVVGGVMLAAGVILYFTAPRSTAFPTPRSAVGVSW
jgi:serine/threonine-protein kinase